MRPRRLSTIILGSLKNLYSADSSLSPNTALAKEWTFVRRLARQRRAKLDCTSGLSQLSIALAVIATGRRALAFDLLPPITEKRFAHTE